ncbi:MAG: hypothetical protein A2X86_01975 [Bdellovibrionales bacterium GWA2_49_15]|nr:MAG: hypothetical protein A2X86_01975 [Bdellovibrionales bacterium GWA2_49_15]
MNTLIKLLALLGLLSTAVHATILGKDNRQPMTSTQYPWTAIGLLAIGNTGVCTATLVGPRLILTAAHCLVDARTKRLQQDITNVVFYPNYMGGKARHGAKVVRSWVGTFDAQNERWSDWAVAELEAPLGKIYGFVPVVSYTGVFLNFAPSKVTLAGYSTDFLSGQTAGVDVDCQLRAQLKVDDARKVVTHDCDMRPGASGGPILMFVNSRPQVVAVNVAEKDQYTFFTRQMGIDVQYNINTAMNLAVPTDVMMSAITLMNLD